MCNETFTPLGRVSQEIKELITSTSGKWGSGERKGVLNLGGGEFSAINGGSQGSLRKKVTFEQNICVG